MRASPALKLVREKMNNPELVIKPERTRVSGYKKKRGADKQALYDSVTVYAMANPLTTVNEISQELKISSNVVYSALKEARIRKTQKNSGLGKSPWIKSDFIPNPEPSI